MRALIVDDSRFMRGHLRRMLTALGFESEAACDGEAGLKLLRDGPPFDLALVDWNMPVMNGLEMLKNICAEEFTEMKVMMVTSEAETESICRALESGADEYLMKPFDTEALREKLALLGLVEG